LAKNPQERFQQPSELVGELLLLADELGLQSTSHGGTVWITPNHRQPGWIERLIPIVVSVVGLVLTVWLLDYFLPAGRNSDKLAVDQSDGPHIIARENNAPKPTNESNEDGANDTANKRTIDNDDSSNNKVDRPVENKSTTIDAPETTSDGSDSPGVNVVQSSTNALAELVGNFDQTNAVGLQAVEGKVALISEDQGSGLSFSSGDASSFELNSADAITQISETTRNTADISIRTLIVGPAESGMPVDSLPVDSLEAACRIASELPDVNTIEIWSNGPMVIEPFELRSATLTIRAGEGFTPEIIFRNTDRNFASNGRMLRLVGGSLLFENLHFRVELPKEISDGWSLFSLDRVGRLDLDDCTMTIINATESGLTLQEKVSFFEILEPPKTEMMAGGKTMPVDPPMITLNRCIARGHATLVRVRLVTPFVLDWTQGLFASTQRLVETGGAIMEPELDAKIKINLNHVTVAADQGLCLMEARIDAPYQLFLLISCNHCLFDCYAALPMIEHRGARGEMEPNQRMKLTANSCWFQNKCLLWQLIPLEGSNIATFIRDRELRNEMMNSTTPWFDEHLSETIKSTTFRKWPLDEQSVHLHTATDYLLSDLAKTDDGSIAGFDPELLPQPPAAVEKTNGDEAPVGTLD